MNKISTDNEGWEVISANDERTERETKEEII